MLEELTSFINGLGIRTESVCTLDPKSPSLLIPDEKIVIHPVSNGAASSAAYLHSKAQMEGNRLIAIHTSDWLRNPEAIKARLHVVFHTGGRTHANRMTAKTLPLSDAIEFFDKYHPSGFPDDDDVDYRVVGLIKDEEIMAMMLIGVEDVTYAGNFIYCYSTKGTVIGGAKKLFEYAQEHHSNPETEFYADCDLNWETGGLYYSLGFTPCYYIDPEQHWQCGWTKFIWKP